MTFDAESSGLLDGLTDKARAERAELLDWLVGQGFSVEEIGASFSPMLLPARRVLGYDGSQVSARQISEAVGLDLEQVIRFQRAAGLPHVDDPDAAMFTSADGDTAVHIKRFLDLGFDPDLMLNIVRVLAQGLANASEVMNVAALATVLKPGASELDTAQGTLALVSAAAPLLGPMINDLLLLQLRHTLETDAVNASERAAGVPLPEATSVPSAGPRSPSSGRMSGFAEPTCGTATPACPLSARNRVTGPIIANWPLSTVPSMSTPTPAKRTPPSASATRLMVSAVNVVWAPNRSLGVRVLFSTACFAATIGSPLYPASRISSRARSRLGWR